MKQQIQYIVVHRKYILVHCKQIQYILVHCKQIQCIANKSKKHCTYIVKYYVPSLCDGCIVPYIGHDGIATLLIVDVWIE